MSNRKELRLRLHGLERRVGGRGDGLDLSSVWIDYDDTWQPTAEWRDVGHNDFVTLYEHRESGHRVGKYRCRLSDQEIRRRGGDPAFL